MIVKEWRELDRWPALPKASEWTGSRVIRGEPCACGGWIVQHLGQSIPEVVTDHNRTVQHRAWRYELD